MVDGAIVARFAALVTGFGAESTRFFYVAGVAMRGKHGVGGGNTTSAVHVVVAEDGKPTEPQKRGDWSGHRENEAQAPEWMRALEIIQIDALSEVFSCELGSGHVNSTLPQYRSDMIA